MRGWVIGIMLSCCMGIAAQGFTTPWIADTTPDSCSIIWFRQTYMLQARPMRALLEVATTGLVRVYVNGVCVSGNVYAPYRPASDTTAISITYDIRRFLRPDSNTIALLYAPSSPHVTRKQVAVWFYGRNQIGVPFCHTSDSQWICKKSDRRLIIPYNEIYDNSENCQLWTADFFDPACWTLASRPAKPDLSPVKRRSKTYEEQKITKVLLPQYFDVEGDTINYAFQYGFYGFVRVTLRKAQKGERVFINGFQYVCNGQMDEQAYAMFTPSFAHRVIIYGDSCFNQEQIQRVEALNITPVFHQSYSY